MFDWIYDLLYAITKSICKLIDSIVQCCNMLAGLDPVKIDGKNQNLMTWLTQSDRVETGFNVTAMVGIILLVFFTIWKMVTTIVSEKPDGTPAQIMVKAGKTLLTFLFVPLVMYLLIVCGNTLMQVLYAGTSGGSSQGLGTFLALSFGEEAKYSSDVNLYTAGIDYKSTSQMWQYINMKDYDYFFSWIAGGFILFTLTKILMIFVDRVFSIVLLYIISPIPIAAAMVDEGQRFKAWRDQLLAKFFVGYGAMIGLNIFAIVMSSLVAGDVVYFQGNSFLNFLFKVVIMLGGCFALDKIVAMIGNIVSNGAGDAAMGQANGMINGVGSAASMVAKGVAKLAKKDDKKGKGGAGGGGEGGGDGGGDGEGSSDSNKSPTASNDNNNPTGGDQDSNPVADAIQGGGGGEGGSKGGGEKASGGGEGGQGGGEGNENPGLKQRIKSFFSNVGSKIKNLFSGGGDGK